MNEQQNPAIRLQGVTLSRAHFRLGPLNLEVPAGYVTAIIGPNGSGKSTTFRLMLDLMKPDEGSIEIFGQRMGRGKQIELLRRIGYLPEEAYRHDNVIRGMDKADFHRQWYDNWDVHHYRELLRIFEVDHSIRLGKMSKGMRRKFDLALALSHHPDLLLLDEPSSGLDPLAWRSMIELLHRYMETGDRTILIATHIVEEVKRLADYIVFMMHGKVLGVYEKDELITGWHQFYFTGSYDEWRGKLAEMPGLAGLEDAGGVVRAISGLAHEAEAWLSSNAIIPAGRKAMELDDILAVLVEQEKLRRQQGMKGVRK